MLSFTEFIKEQNTTIEELIQSNEVLSIIEESDEIEELTEASFQFGGKTYKTAWGKYSCDGKSITRDEYLKASNAYKNSNKVGYKEKTKQDVANYSNKVRKPLANSYVNINNIIDKYEDFDWNSIKDYDYMMLYKNAVNNFIYRANNAKKEAWRIQMLKTYIESPEKLSKKEKNFIEDSLAHYGRGKKNKEKILFNVFLDRYRYNKERADHHLKTITRCEKSLESGKI